jgi:hypothetical protein
MSGLIEESRTVLIQYQHHQNKKTECRRYTVFPHLSAYRAIRARDLPLLQIGALSVSY